MTGSDRATAYLLTTLTLMFVGFQIGVARVDDPTDLGGLFGAALALGFCLLGILGFEVWSTLDEGEQ